jgi:hypothetical protein
MGFIEMSFMDAVARFFLLFSNDIKVVLLVIVAGLCSNQSKAWGQALSLMLFAAVFNTLLKNYYAVPLADFIKEPGFAYPSGHMHTATSLYGWALLHSSLLWLRFSLLALIVGTGWGLVHFGYHVPVDVFASVGFVLATFIACKLILNNSKFMKTPALFSILFMILTFMCLVGIYYQTNTPPGKFYHCSLYAYVSLGFSLSWFISSILLGNQKDIFNKARSKLSYLFRVVVNYFVCGAIIRYLLIATSFKYIALGASVPLLSAICFGKKGDTSS